MNTKKIFILNNSTNQINLKEGKGVNIKNILLQKIKTENDGVFYYQYSDNIGLNIYFVKINNDEIKIQIENVKQIKFEECCVD